MKLLEGTLHEVCRGMIREGAFYVKDNLPYWLCFYRMRPNTGGKWSSCYVTGDFDNVGIWWRKRGKWKPTNENPQSGVGTHYRQEVYGIQNI